MTDSRQVVDLIEVDGSMLELVGGKAANLGELRSAGANVPPGFCVTTKAYDEVCRDLIGHLVDRLDADSDAAAEIREKLANADLPPALASAIADAYTALGTDVPVAVRSSATAEDLPHASFAGQQDTFLNVIGTTPLLDAVRRCWSSLWTDRAVSYRAANGIDQRSVRLAVVVQRMVDAQSAGVLFSANPVTGHRGQSVIDANTGLGESVVSGNVTPDHFIVEARSGTIRTRELGEKEVSVRPKPGGGTEYVPQQGRDHASLTDDQIHALVAAGADVARHFGSPQDVEWAIDGDGVLWLTQSRPITTLFPLPADPDRGFHMYFSVNVAQGVYRPLTPLGVSVLRLISTGIVRNLGISINGSPLRNADGWLFLDITGAARNRLGRRVVPHLMAMGEVRTGSIFTSMLDDPRLSLRHAIPWTLLRRVAKVLLRTRMPVMAGYALRSPDRARDRVFRTVQAIRRDLDRTPGSSMPISLAAQEILTMVTRRITRIAPIVFTGLVSSRLLPRVLGDSVTTEEVQIVLRGIPHNVTTEMDLDLWRIADHVRRNRKAARLFSQLSSEELAIRYQEGNLPSSVQSELEAFLDRNGHRTAAEIDAGMPRWSENPAPVLDIVAHYAETARSGHSADEQYRQGVAEAEAKVTEIVARLRQHSRVRARVAALMLDRVRQLVGLREVPKYCAVLVIAYVRRHVRVAAEQLVAEGRLDRVDDVVFLALDEIDEAVAGADHRQLVQRRRTIHERELRRKHIPRVLLSDGTEPETDLLRRNAIAGDGMLVGSPASAGTVTGPAKVVRDPAGARLEPGEILVAPSTDPGWTPLFLTAGGLVMEMGGPNSHGATVAREYGIPAVVGVPDATTRIATGRRITVNGSTGTVEPG